MLFAVQPLVQTEFQLTNAQVGYLTSAFLLFYMVAAPFVGPLADRYSRKLIIVLGAVFWSGLTLMTAVTHTYRELLIRHTLVGVGEATFRHHRANVRRRSFSGKQTRPYFRNFLSGHSRWHSSGIFAGWQARSIDGMALSVLYRGVSRILTRTGGLVPSGTATRPV